KSLGPSAPLVYSNGGEVPYIPTVRTAYLRVPDLNGDIAQPRQNHRPSSLYMYVFCLRYCPCPLAPKHSPYHVYVVLTGIARLRSLCCRNYRLRYIALGCAWLAP
ncbi:unnamed protein product, partial [Ectocarpus sp. 6 AP-2014]